MTKSTKTQNNPPKKATANSKRKRRLATQDSRDAILDAALIEFSALGFKGSSIRNIGKRAKVDFTLITYYFGNKETLWQEVLIRGAAKHAAAAGQPFSELAKTPGQQLRLRLRREYEFASSSDSLYHMVMIELRSKGCPRLEWLTQNFLKPAYESALPMIEAAQASGEIAQGDPLLLYELLQVGIRALISTSQHHELIAAKPANHPATQAAFWELVEQLFFANVKQT